MLLTLAHTLFYRTYYLEDASSTEAPRQNAEFLDSLSKTSSLSAAFLSMTREPALFSTRVR